MATPCTTNLLARRADGTNQLLSSRQPHDMRDPPLQSKLATGAEVGSEDLHKASLDASRQRAILHLRIVAVLEHGLPGGRDEGGRRQRHIAVVAAIGLGHAVQGVLGTPAMTIGDTQMGCIGDVITQMGVRLI